MEEPSKSGTQSLTPIEFAVLALVGRRGQTAYDLALWANSGEWGLLGYSRSSLHEVPKRLERRGHLRGEEVPAAKGGKRRLYRLTDAGVAAVREWLATPPGLPVVDSELVVRTLSRDLMRTDDWLESLLALRPAIEHRRAVLNLARQKSSSAGNESARLLAFALHEELLNAYTAWLKGVEAEFAEGETNWEAAQTASRLSSA